MSTTFNVIYLGTHPLIDPIEGNTAAEDASTLLGTYGSATDPLFEQIQDLTQTSDNGEVLDQDNTAGSDTFQINGGADQTFDATATYAAVLTYADGTTATISVVVFQDTLGRTYLAPDTASQADLAALEAKPIQSITLTSVLDADTVGMAARQTQAFFEVSDDSVEAVNDRITVTESEGAGDVDGNVLANDTQVAQRLVLLEEDFNDLSAVADRGDWDFERGVLTGDATDEGRIRFNTVDLTGLTATTVSFDSRVFTSGFESTDTLTVDLLDVYGNIVLTLDSFRGTGGLSMSSIMGTGKTITGSMSTLTYDVPDGLGAVQLSFNLNVSSILEDFDLDNVRIEADDPSADQYDGAVVAVNGQTGQVGTYIDLAEGGRVRINADGSVDFDADGDFEDLNTGEFRDVTVSYSIEGEAPEEPGTPIGEPIVAEAEDLALYGGFAAVANANGIGVWNWGATGSVTLNNFSGSTGSYSVSVFTQDIAGGQASFRLLVNGAEVASFVTNRDTGSSWYSSASEEFTFSGIDIGAGDQVRLEMLSRDSAELFVLDRLEFTRLETEPEQVTGESTTVTFRVMGETDFPVTAFDDEIIVTESEAAGDTEVLTTGATSILANDRDDGDVDYTGNVVSVNGVAGQVGAFIDLAAGGRVRINADGSVDFDADGDFEALNAGDTAQVTVDYTIQGAPMGGTVPKHNILFVVDISGSVDGAFGGTPVGDVNGDGLHNTILDAQIAAYQDLIAEIQTSGLTDEDVDIGLVVFSGAQDVDNQTGAGRLLGTFKPSDGGLQSALTDLRTDQVPLGATNFEAGLQQGVAFFAGQGATTADENIIYFLSDGINNRGGALTDEVATLADTYGAKLNAVGVGSGAVLDQLNEIDNTGGAEIVTTTDALSAALTDTVDQIPGALDSATLTITVQGETDIALEAVDDRLTVLESEGAGDLDSLEDGSDSVLDNDIAEGGGAYAGAVLSVNGQQAQVGQFVDLAEGGRIRIAADGTVDFDADGDFDGLDEGQLAEILVEYGISTTELVADPGVGGSTPGPVAPPPEMVQNNILFVVDISGSVKDPFGGTPVGDVNGDGLHNTILDAEIAAYLDLVDQIEASGLSAEAVQIGLVVFSGAQDLNDQTGASRILGTFSAGDPALTAALTGLIADEVPLGATNFEAGLQAGVQWFEGEGATTADNNVVYFLSDGQTNVGGAFSDEVAVLETTYAAKLNAVGVGSAARLIELNQIDNTGGAQVVTTTEALSAALVESFDPIAQEDRLTVTESEGAGDLEVLDSGETSLLANDISAGGVQADAVIEVNGQSGSVGQWIDLEAGGRVLINADGTLDFDADGDFEAYNTGESITFAVDYAVETTTEAAGKQNNILFVVDVSLSVDNAFGGTAVGDVNGDGQSNTILDAQIAAYLDLVSQIQASGLPTEDVTIGLVVFSGAQDELDQTGASRIIGTFAADDPALSSALTGLLTDQVPLGATNFEAGLQQGVQWFADQNATPDDNNVVYFLSDGDANRGSAFGDEVSTLQATYGAQVNAVGMGSGAVLTQLDQIDNTGGAEIVTTTDALSAALVGTVGPVVQQDSSRVLITVEGETDFTEIVTTDTATLTVTVQGEFNQPIDATDDYLVVSESETAGDLEVLFDGASTILANDIASGGGAYAGSVVTVNGVSGNVGQFIDLSQGRVMINADGTLDFDADGDFDALNAGDWGFVSLNYSIADAGGSDTAQLYVYVEGENDPVDAVDDTIVVSESEGAGDTDGQALLNDTTNGAPVVSVGGVTGAVGQFIDLTEGRVRVNADGSIDFDANGDFEDLNDGDSRSVTLTYSIDDGVTSDTATITVVVNGETDIPLDALDDALTVTESEGAGDLETLDSGAASVLANDIATGGGAYAGSVVTVNGVSGNVGQFIDLAQGRVLINADGSIDFDADGDFEDLNDGDSRSVALTYSIDDGTSADMATVTVTVTGETDIPLDAIDDALTVSESETFGDTETLSNGAMSLLANDIASGGGAYAGAVVTVNGVAGLVGQFIDLSQGRVLVNADGSIDFDTDGDFAALTAGQSQTVTFTYGISDGAQSDTATVSVTVQGEDDPSQLDAIDDAIAVSTMEGPGDAEPLTGGGISILGNDIGTAGGTFIGDVLAVNGDAANVDQWVDLAGGGRVLVGADGSVDFDADGDFNTLEFGQIAQVSFDYTIADAQISDTATVTIDVSNTMPMQCELEIEPFPFEGLDEFGNPILVFPEFDLMGNLIVAEGGQGTLLAISRACGPTDDELILTLSSNNDAEIDYDPVVTFAAGEVEAFVLVTAVDDGVIDGDQFVFFNASAAGFDDGFISLVVTDNDMI